jgi:hypothetical protein
MKKGSFCAVPALLLLASCSAPQIVRFPADGQSAKLRYLTSAARSDGTYLWRVDRSQCPRSVKTMLIATTGEEEKSDVGMFDSSDQAQALVRELNVPASGPFTFYVTASRYGAYSSYSCDNAGVFQPLPGRQYELNYIVEPTTFVCIVRIDELQRGPDGQVTRQREPSAHYFHPPKKDPDYCGEAPR